MKVILFAAQARASSGFSARNPYPGCSASQPGAARDSPSACRYEDNFRARERGLSGTLHRHRRTCNAARSASLKTAAEVMPISRQARAIRTAISPRLAMRILRNIFSKRSTASRILAQQEIRTFEVTKAGEFRDHGKPVPDWRQGLVAGLLSSCGELQQESGLGYSHREFPRRWRRTTFHVSR